MTDAPTMADTLIEAAGRAARALDEMLTSYEPVYRSYAAALARHYAGAELDAQLDRLAAALGYGERPENVSHAVAQNGQI